jgi:GNAT superfamily N-acetyltransferase
MGLEQVNVVIWPEVVGLTDDGGDRFHRFWSWLESFVPSEPHWMLDMGRQPDPAREGIGSALVRWRRARADGVPAFLETSKARNVPYYERFGFRTATEEDAPDGGPHIWFMRLDQ